MLSRLHVVICRKKIQNVFDSAPKEEYIHLFPNTFICTCYTLERHNIMKIKGPGKYHYIDFRNNLLDPLEKKLLPHYEILEIIKVG